MQTVAGIEISLANGPQKFDGCYAIHPIRTAVYLRA